MRSAMRYGTRKPNHPKCAICHVRVGNLHDVICPRRLRTPMTVEYSDTNPADVTVEQLDAYKQKGGI